MVPYGRHGIVVQVPYCLLAEQYERLVLELPVLCNIRQVRFIDLLQYGRLGLLICCSSYK